MTTLDLPIKKRALIVDDEELILEFCVEMLKNFNYEVETAIDGFDALMKVDNFKPDIVITDLNMPRMDGFELIKILQQKYVDLPILVVSGFAPFIEVFNKTSLYKSGFLTKPFSYCDLIKNVMKLLNQSVIMDLDGNMITQEDIDKKV